MLSDHQWEDQTVGLAVLGDYPMGVYFVWAMFPSLEHVSSLGTCTLWLDG